jgi:hypothetical protein
MCQNLFGMIDIMCCRLPYVSGGVLLLKILVLYIYRPRDTMNKCGIIQHMLFFLQSGLGINLEAEFDSNSLSLLPAFVPPSVLAEFSAMFL